MKRINLVGFFSLFAMLNLSYACFDPQSKFYSGVLFDNGETVDMAKLESFGLEGVNYIKQCDASNNCSIRYRGHYGENTLVHLGYYTSPVSASMHFPRIVVALDTTKTPSLSEKALAVATELTWLLNHGVVRLSDDESVHNIQEALSMFDGQFWTLQGKVLSYNSWFVYDTVVHSWRSDGINGVYSVDGVKGGCGANIDYGLPKQPLSAAAVGAPKGLMAVAQKPLTGPARLEDIYTLQGRKIARPVPVRPGIYLVRDRTMQCRRMVLSNSASW